MNQFKADLLRAAERSAAALEAIAKHLAPTPKLMSVLEAAGGKEAFDELIARELDGFRPTGAATVRKDGDLLWLNPGDVAALAATELSAPIEVRYKVKPATAWDGKARMCLGDAIEWSTLDPGRAGVHRTLKASIAEWRPL